MYYLTYGLHTMLMLSQLLKSDGLSLINFHQKVDEAIMRRIAFIEDSLLMFIRIIIVYRSKYSLNDYEKRHFSCSIFYKSQLSNI